MSITKGKWIVRRRPDNFEDYDIFAKDVNNAWIARCFGSKGKANAHLIAAAPALLAACEAAMFLCKEMCKGGHNPEHRRICKLCIAAIAAAKPKEETER